MSGVSSTSSEPLHGRVADSLRWFAAVPLQKQTYYNLAYLLLAFPLGLGYFVFVTVAVSVGIGLAILVVGLVLLAVTVVVALVLAGFERWLTVRMLDVDIEPRTSLSGDRRRDRVYSLVRHKKTWTGIVYLPTKFVLGIASFVAVVTTISTAVSMMLLPLYYDRPGLYVGVVSDRAPEIHQTLYLGWNYLLVGVEAAFTLGYWEISTLPQALVGAGAGLLLLLASLHLLNGIAILWGRYARFMLEDCYDVVGVALE